MRECTPGLTRRALLAGFVGGTVLRLQPPIVALAQNETPAAVATPAAGVASIRPIGVGEVPSTGGRRPGPVSLIRFRTDGDVVSPVGLRIEVAGVDAGIEALRVVDGAMQDPTGPWVVAWYENLGSLGRPGNMVMAGHIDYWNVGPSVFYSIDTLQPGDEIFVTGDDGKSYPFAVEWVRQFDSTSMPLDDVTGPTEAQSLTLITCGGAFDYANGQYLQRTVVRANRTGSAASPPV